MNETTMIRARLATKDKLSFVAHAQNKPLIAYLDELAEREMRDLILESERRAVEHDLTNPVAVHEYELWEGTLADGID